MCWPLRWQASSYRFAVEMATVGAGLPAKNDNAVYRPGTRHKYQEATVR